MTTLHTLSHCILTHPVQMFIWLFLYERFAFLFNPLLRKLSLYLRSHLKRYTYYIWKWPRRAPPPPSFPEMWKSENVQSYYLFVMENRLFDEAFQVFHWHSCVATHFEKDTHFEKKNQSRVDLGQFIFFWNFFFKVCNYDCTSTCINQRYNQMYKLNV